MSGPERVWAWAWEVDRHRGQWSEVQEIVGEGAEYIRADLHAAAIARAERAEAALAMMETTFTAIRDDVHLMMTGRYGYLGKIERACNAALSEIAALKGGAA